MLVNAGSSANMAVPRHACRKLAGFGNHIAIKPDGSFSGWSSAGRFCGSDSHYKIYAAGQFNQPASAPRCGRMTRSTPTLIRPRASTPAHGSTSASRTNCSSRSGSPL